MTKGGVMDVNTDIEETCKDIAAELLRVYSSYPSKSTEYTIWLQDLSKGIGGSRPLLPDNIRIGREPFRQAVYDAIMLADLSLQRFFIIYYITRWPRAKKIAVLGLADKNAFYAQRDRLHAFIEGAVSKLKKVV